MTITKIGEWGFLDNLNDTSGNGRNGTASGTFDYIDGPVANTRAIKFISATSYVDVGRTGLEPAAASGGFTIMAWARYPMTGITGDFHGILNKPRAASSTRSGMAITEATPDRQFYMARWKDDLHYAEVTTINDSLWHHYAVIDGDTYWAFIIDGTVIQSGTRSFDTGTSPTWEAFNWRIGADTTLNNASGPIEVTAVRIFSGQATLTEVQTWKDIHVTSTPPVEKGIFVGSVAASAIYAGSVAASKVYLGATLVWPSNADYYTLVAAESPLLWLRFNETSGTVATDSSGNGRNGTYSGGPTFSQAALLDGTVNSVLFDNTNDIVTVTDSTIGTALSSGWTIELIWEPPATLPGDASELALFTNGYTSTVGAAFRHTGGRIRASFYNSSWRGGGGGLKPIVGRKYHIVGTWDGTTLKTYVNGWFNAYEIPGIAAVFNNANWYVNRQWDVATHFGGKYDEAIIYAGAQSQTKIEARWAALSASQTPTTWTPVLTNNTPAAGLSGWTARNGTWTGGGTYGVSQTNSATNVALEYDTNLSTSLRRIQATIRLPATGYCGIAFTNGGNIGSNDLGVKLSANLDTVTTDSFGGNPGMVTAPLTLAPDTDYVLVVEETSEGSFKATIDGVRILQAWLESVTPNKGFVTLLSSGLSGTGWWRDISIWTG